MPAPDPLPIAPSKTDTSKGIPDKSITVMEGFKTLVEVLSKQSIGKPPVAGPPPHTLSSPSASSNPITVEIEEESKSVQILATRISKRILLFEKWLNQLPGRVEARHWDGGFVDSFENPEPMSFGLILKRSGKTWSIYWAWQHDGDESEPDWKLLSDADLDTKVKAIEYFPHLLTAIKRAQEGKKVDLLIGIEKFDKFAESVGLKIEGEDD